MLYQLVGCMAQCWEGKCCISSPPALFTIVVLIQYQLNTWLSALWSREEKDKVQNSQGRLSHKFLNQHQIASLKQNGSKCRPLQRDRGNQVPFGVGQALTQLKRQHSLFSFILQRFLGNWPSRSTGSCPILWQLTGRLTGQPSALRKEKYSQWGLTGWWALLCCLSDILSGFPPWFFCL